jgi:tripartite-type tricarboxylate transporter receptor subunit TctC
MPASPNRTARTLFSATITIAVLAAGLTAPAPDARAQDYPSKPVRLIVPSPPGDGSDLMARAIGQKLAEAWGQQVVVDNRPGAGGRVGTELAAKAPADGYTWIMGNAGSHGINAAVYKSLPFDVERDFAPITQVMRSPNVLVVSPSLGVSNVSDFVALLKKNPGKYSYGSGGNGSSAHLSAELFKMMAGVDVVHVPYKGATPALTDVIAGQIAMFFGNLPPAMGHIQGGRVKALGVSTLKRTPMLPDVPTLDETGLKGFETVAWFGLLAPAGTPRPIVTRVQADVAKVLQAPDIRERLATLGGEPVGNTPEEFAAIIRGDVAKWKRVVEAAKISVD